MHADLKFQLYTHSFQQQNSGNFGFIIHRNVLLFNCEVCIFLKKWPTFEHILSFCKEKFHYTISFSKQKFHYTISFCKQEFHYTILLCKQKFHYTMSFCKQKFHYTISLCKQKFHCTISFCKQKFHYTISFCKICGIHLSVKVNLSTGFQICLVCVFEVQKQSSGGVLWKRCS